jgi:hypothetical protein
MQNIFDNSIVQSYITRILALKPDSQRNWGKMTSAQMLAHCNITYSMIFEPEKHKKPSALARFLLKTFVKNKVTNPFPYKQNLPTSPLYLVNEDKNFQEEQKKLISYLQKVQQLGKASFEGKVHLSFGKLSSQEWNNLMAKHLNHHLTQFGI